MAEGCVCVCVCYPLTCITGVAVETMVDIIVRIMMVIANMCVSYMLAGYPTLHHRVVGYPIV